MPDEADGDNRRKWFLAVVLACPPCLAAGLASLGSGLGAALALKGLVIAASVVAVATILGVWIASRRRRACPV